MIVLAAPVRTGGAATTRAVWKLVREPGEAPRLRDLAVDPGERVDLAAAEPEHRVAQAPPDGR